MLPPCDTEMTSEEEAVTIEPQYDGVIMLSPEAVLFSDARPRPDGSKVYHVFERTLTAETTTPTTPRDDNNTTTTHSDDNTTTTTHSDDFHSRRDQLFSQAHENTLHGIQQVLAESGLVNQEWCEGNHNTADNNTNNNNNNNNTTTFSQPSEFSSPTHHNLPHLCLSQNQHLIPSRLHQFEMMFPIQQKRRLLKRLKRKGIGNVEFEPENHRINIKTRRSVSTILSVLCRVDPTARHLGSYRDSLFEDEAAAEEEEDNSGGVGR
ncbi:hypothetical protein Pmani_017122 [Petrolisthes manimaculis]|uniref:Uncharacterized protein n=1 Tax=Petrolisthes manimaculis TaxID=1843537 RepID=A0AAE1U5R8_9EUCA|nr:hypothetical protein Pmani_017122 [Petrolisthes manimaculis]